MKWVRFQISQNHANTGEKYEIFTPNRDTIQEFFAVWMQQYAFHFSSRPIFEFTNVWYYNAGSLGSNLKTKTSDMYFLHKKLAVTVLNNGVKHWNLDASKLTVLHGIVFAHEMYKYKWCNSNTICIYVYHIILLL